MKKEKSATEARRNEVIYIIIMNNESNEGSKEKHLKTPDKCNKLLVFILLYTLQCATLKNIA